MFKTNGGSNESGCGMYWLWDVSFASGTVLTFLGTSSTDKLPGTSITDEQQLVNGTQDSANVTLSESSHDSTHNYISSYCTT